MANYSTQAPDPQLVELSKKLEDLTHAIEMQIESIETLSNIMNDMIERIIMAG